MTNRFGHPENGTSVCACGVRASVVNCPACLQVDEEEEEQHKEEDVCVRLKRVAGHHPL